MQSLESRENEGASPLSNSSKGSQKSSAYRHKERAGSADGEPNSLRQSLGNRPEEAGPIAEPDSNLVEIFEQLEMPDVLKEKQKTTKAPQLSDEHAIALQQPALDRINEAVAS